jgi:transcriptional regulator GlxA family with amidase domain
MFPDLDVKSNHPWVDEGHVVSSAGISAGIGMSLHLVSRLATEDLAFRTARQMEFDWKRND